MDSNTTTDCTGWPERLAAWEQWQAEREAEARQQEAEEAQIAI